MLQSVLGFLIKKNSLRLYPKLESYLHMDTHTHGMDIHMEYTWKNNIGELYFT